MKYKYIDLGTFKEEINSGAECATFRSLDSGKSYCIQFASQPTGFGTKYFLQCPSCKERRTILYEFHDMLLCRSCLQKFGFRVYKKIQDVTDGGQDYIDYVIRKYTQKHNIELIFEQRTACNGLSYNVIDFYYLDYTYHKPKGIHWRTWEKEITILQALFNMRFQCTMMNRSFSTAVIRSILNYTNIFLFMYDIYWIKHGIIYWERGIEYTGQTYEEGIMTKAEVQSYVY